MTEWRPDKLERRLPALQARARLQAAIRQWFAEEGFVEVETPILQVAPGAEVHLSGFATDWELPDGEERERWLHSSPEFAMKKLLAGGVPRLFQFARVFRNAEGSALHHPEFTMLEWYRAGVGYEAIMQDCQRLLALTGESELRWGEHRCDPRAEPERLTVAEAFRRHAGVDLFATVGSADKLARAAGIAMHEGDSWDDVFFRIMFDRIESKLGMGRPTILCEYPIAMAALARAKPADPRVAERFELYVCGVELANAFGELTDPDIQRARLQADMDEKERLYGVRWPVDEDFLAALDHGLPDCAGIALGFDRLVMLATGASAYRGRAVAAGTVKGRGSRTKNLVLALASTAVALLIGIWVTAYLTVWPPAMSAVGDGTVIYDPEIGLVARPSAHTRHIYPAIADRAAFAFDIYTDDRGARVDGPGQRSAARYDIMTVGDSFTWAYALANPDSYAARLGRELGASVDQFRVGELRHDPVAADPRAQSRSQAKAGGLRHHRPSLRAQRLALRAVVLRVLPRCVPCLLGRRRQAVYRAAVQRRRPSPAGPPERRLSLAGALADARRRRDLRPRCTTPGAATANRTMRKRRRPCSSSCSA